MIKVGQIRQWVEDKDHFKITRIIGGCVHYKYIDHDIESYKSVDFIEYHSIEIPQKSENFTTLYDKLNEVPSLRKDHLF